jgi:hypothetical protein
MPPASSRGVEAAPHHVVARSAVDHDGAPDRVAQLGDPLYRRHASARARRRQAFRRLSKATSVERAAPARARAAEPLIGRRGVRAGDPGQRRRRRKRPWTGSLASIVARLPQPAWRNVTSWVAASRPARGPSRAMSKPARRWRSESASIAATRPPRTVKAMTEKSSPGGVTTTPGTPFNERRPHPGCEACVGPRPRRLRRSARARMDRAAPRAAPCACTAC